MDRMRRAFTLVELRVVMGIIAILMGLLLPSLAKARRAGQIVQCSSNLRQLGIAFTFYAAAHRDVYPAAQDPVMTDPYKTLWMGMGYRPLLEPFLSGSTGRPSAFICPADRRGLTDDSSITYAYSMCFYRSGEEIDSAYTNYTEQYLPVAPATTLRPPMAQKLSSVRFPSQKILAGEFYCHHDTLTGDMGWWDTRGNRTFLFADGHVELLNASQIQLGRDGLPDPNVTIHGVKGIDIR